MKDDTIYENDIISMYQDLDVDLTLEVLSKIYEMKNYKSYSKQDLKKKKREHRDEIYLFAISYTSKLNSKRIKGLKRIFSDITDNISNKYKNDDFDIEKCFKERDKIIDDSIKSTNETLKSLGKKIAVSVKNDMLKLFDESSKKLISGSYTFDEVFKKVTDELVEKGVTFQDKLGRNRSVESVVRQELRYRSNECSRDYNKQIAKELGYDGWQINITINCRPTHEVINGKRFSNEEWKEYEHLTHDYNCNHIPEPVFMWQSERYTDDEINNLTSKIVSYNGKDMSWYDATQMQRAYERAIRNAKKQCVIAKKTNFEIDKAKNNLKKAQNKMKNFLNQTGLERNYSREYFSGYSR